MSAESCGCDAAVGWICKTHRAMPTEAERAAWVRTNAFNNAFAMQAEMNRKTSQALEVVAHPPLTALEQALIDTKRHLEMLTAQIAELESRVLSQMGREQRIAAVLRTFAASPLSLSSVQPLLNLNDELNGAR
jgi:BMFP domain-containing protein YqiC